MTDSLDVMLGEVLRRVAADSPAAERVSQRALRLAQAGRTGKRQRALPFRFMVPAGAVAAVALSWMLLYFVPTLAVAVEAGAPGGVDTQLLDRVGLASKDLTEAGATMVSAGISVRIVGVYADSIRTVVVLQSADGVVDPASVTLTDQFGHRYTVTHAVSDSRVGLEAMTFPGFATPIRITGARIHFSAGKVTNGPQSVIGQWTLDAVVLPKSARNLSAEPGHIGDRTATFVAIVRSGSSLMVVVRVDGQLPAAPDAVPGAKPAPTISAALVSPNGTIAAADIFADHQDGATKITATWVGISAGSYQLELTVSGATIVRQLSLGASG